MARSRKEGCVRVCVGEGGVHIIYSTRKVFLERAVVELVYTRSPTGMFEKVTPSLKYD